MNIANHGSRFNRAWLLALTPLLFTNVGAQTSGEGDEMIEEIVITGSRIARAGFDTLMPAIVIDSQFLEDRGFTDVATALNELPAFGLPGNSTEGDQSSYSAGQNFVNLYGLGSQRTLTLVNGRRFVSSSSPSLFVNQAAGLQVDLNMIPTVLVDRIETISIGGAPIYGADAIAGTVNVLMKQDFEGFDIRSSYGISQENEMEETVFSIGFGANTADGRGNVSLAIEHSDRGGMIESDMPHLKEGWQFRETGGDFQLSLVRDAHANIVSPNGVATPGALLIPSIGLGEWPDGSYLQFSPDGTLVDYDVGTPTENIVWSVGGDGLFLPDVTSLYTPLRRTLAVAFAHYELAPQVEVFTEFWAAQSKGTELVNQSAYQSGVFGEESFALNFSVDHPLLTQQARDTLVAQGVDNFWLQRESRDLRPDGNRNVAKGDLMRGVLGLRGDFTAIDRDFEWEVSYNRGRSKSSATGSDISSERFFYALDVVDTPEGVQCRVVADPDSRPDDPADPFGTGLNQGVFDDCVPLDIFGAGRPSAEAIEYIGIQDTAVTTIDQEVIEANLSTTSLFDLPAGGLGFAVGLSTRTESAEFGTSGFTELGLGRSVPVLPVTGEYQSDEAYAEFYAPIFSEDMDIPLISWMSVEGAYRYLDNDFAGTDEAWTVGLKYAPIPDVEFRGNVTRSVRAPAITELFLPLSGLFSFAADPCDATNIDGGPNPSARAANCASGGGNLPPITQPFVSSVRNASVNGRSGGNVNLNNEVADAWTAGIILRPRFVEGLQWSIDYVSFEIEDAIESYSLTNVMTACYDATEFPNDFCNQFRRNPDGQVPAVDAFVVGYVNAGFREYEAITSEILYSFDALGGQWDIAGSILHLLTDKQTLLGTTTDRTGVINQGAPDNVWAMEWQGNFTARYSRDKWSAFLQPRFIGEGIFDSDDVPNKRSVPGEDNVWLFNAGFRYDFTDQISAQLNINNLADELPTPAVIATGNDGIYDNIGRFWRFGLQIRL
jgi:outer membrane receptor protein involved in Fe transport